MARERPAKVHKTIGDAEQKMALLHAMAFWCSLWGILSSDHGAKPTVASKVADLQFKDIHYLTRSLSDLGSPKAIVLIFTNTSCPLVQRYLPELTRLDKDYRPRGVQFVAVDSAPEDSIREIAAQAARHE